MKEGKTGKLGHLNPPINNPRTGNSHIVIYQPIIGL